MEFPLAEPFSSLAFNEQRSFQMAISFSCPHCGHAFQVEDSYAGQTGPCVKCGQPMTVPSGESAFAASASYDPRPPKKTSAALMVGLIAGGIVVVLFCGGILLALLLPAIQFAREDARRAMCINNCKNIGLGLMNHHDIHNRFPVASTSPIASTPGDATSAGYSWFVPLLPFLEQQALLDEIESNSNDFAKLPFEANQGPAATTLPLLICPSGGGPQLSPVASSVYAMQLLPGISNYLATSASHLINNQGPAELANGQNQAGFTGNGILVFPLAVSTKPNEGLGLKSVLDGTSNTVIFYESKEEVYAAWIDGQVTWGVAAWPGNVEVPTTAADGFLGWPNSDVTSITSLAAAEENRTNPSISYMVGTRFGGKLDRQFGPSSNHAGGVVVHAFADGHVTAIAPDIDRTLYLRIVSRSGGEAVDTSGF
jgi:hypothetical protein